jgi:hypothetical protein
MLLKLVWRHNKTATVLAAATAEVDVLILADEAPLLLPDGMPHFSPVHPHLHHNQNVHNNLHYRPGRKLLWYFLNNKVASLKSITAGPHQHHFHAEITN